MAMQKELNQFKTNDVWKPVPNLMDMAIIGTKWVYRNKLDENGTVTRNKARLVAQGYNQQEGLLAYACALDFKLYQMDVKSVSLNDFINEEIYVAQPPGFIDFAKPNYVYRLKKALYGLKQDPKAWYDRLKAFLIKHDYSMGMVDNTLFTKKKDSNLIIVKIYVDDNIFRSTCQEMYDDFAKIMHDEFEIRLWYPKGSGIETIVYADSDHVGDYKQTTLAISTTEAEYVSAEKACQQALWMKQALVDYGARRESLFSNGSNRFRRGCRNGFGNRGAGSSRQKHECYNCEEEGHFIGECLKPTENKAFVRRAWSIREEGDEPQKDAKCLMAVDSQEIETCFFSLSASRTALMLYVEAARYITNTLPLIEALLRALKKGRDLWAPFERYRLSTANFLLRLCISLSVFGGLRLFSVLKGFPPTIMVLGIPVMSAYVHAKTSTLDHRRSCSFLLKLVGKKLDKASCLPSIDETRNALFFMQFSDLQSIIGVLSDESPSDFPIPLFDVMGGMFPPWLPYSSIIHSEGLLLSDSLSALLSFLFRAFLNSIILPLCLRIRGDPIQRT
uniref:CCHC-type domain-containing protein n=1 Tax=Tanacetum cinerariifolium TaxID=118510 RepID=A0A6L2JSR6_TANCI|nr:hypothetical protein [Tanacetum cinerariifolium]